MRRRAVSDPRASSRTAAAIGAAVETIEPPRPNYGSVRARTVTDRPSASTARTRWTDVVSDDGGTASRAAAETWPPDASTSCLQPLQQPRGQGQPEAHLGAPKLDPNVASSEWSV